MTIEQICAVLGATAFQCGDSLFACVPRLLHTPRAHTIASSPYPLDGADEMYLWLFDPWIGDFRRPTTTEACMALGHRTPLSLVDLAHEVQRPTRIS